MSPFTLIAFAGTEDPTLSGDCGCGARSVGEDPPKDTFNDVKVGIVLMGLAAAGLFWWAMKEDRKAARAR